MELTGELGTDGANLGGPVLEIICELLAVKGAEVDGPPAAFETEIDVTAVALEEAREPRGAPEVEAVELMETTGRPEETAVPKISVETAAPEVLGETAVPEVLGEMDVPNVLVETAVPEVLGETPVPKVLGETAVPKVLGETAVPKVSKDTTEALENGRGESRATLIEG